MENIAQISTDLDGQKMWVLCIAEEFIVAGDSGGFMYFWQKETFEFVKKFKLPSGMKSLFAFIYYSFFYIVGLFSLVYKSNIFIGSMLSSHELIAFDFDGNILKTEVIDGFCGGIHPYSENRIVVSTETSVCFFKPFFNTNLF